MDAKLLACALEGEQYPLTLGFATRNDAEKKGLVIVFGASDDTMVFQGAIEDTIDCYEGGIAYLDEKGLLQNKCDDEDCPYFAELKKKAITIKAVWGQEGYSWTYKTNTPHETFEVLDEDDKYCRGIVFSLKDIPAGGEL